MARTPKYAIPLPLVRLLRRVEKRILDNPRRFTMDIYVSDARDWYEHNPTNLPPCGTVACIAGWAMLEDAPAKALRAMTAAQKLWMDEQAGGWFRSLLTTHGVRPDSGHGYPYRRIVATSAWPDKYRVAYTNAKSAAGQARVAARRIEHFIKAGE